MRQLTIWKKQPLYTIANGTNVPVLEYVDIANSIPEAADIISDLMSINCKSEDRYFICENQHD